MSASTTTSPALSVSAIKDVKATISGPKATDDSTLPSSPPSVKLLKVLHLPEEDELDDSPISTAPGSPELSGSLLFEEVGEPTWSLSAYVLDEKLAAMKLDSEGDKLDALPGLEGLGFIW